MIANQHIGTGFEDFLTEQGTLEKTVAVAPKRVLAWQLAKAMEQEHLTAAAMAERMGTTESEVGRLLDPADDTVQLGTVRRAAAAVGRKVRLELTRDRQPFSVSRFSPRQSRPPGSRLVS